jgi:lipid-A-disaccharide synthase
MVVAYRVGALTYSLASLLFFLDYFTLVNLLLNRRAVPEFLQRAATPEALADEVVTLLTDKDAAAAQVKSLDEAAQLLGVGGEAPSLRAARAIVDFAREQRQRFPIGT